MKLLLILLPLLASNLCYGQLRGVVKDARSGEVLRKAKVVAGEQAVTSSDQKHEVQAACNKGFSSNLALFAIFRTCSRRLRVRWKSAMSRSS